MKKKIIKIKNIIKLVVMPIIKYIKENQIKILNLKIIMDMMKLIMWKELLIIIHILNLFIQEKKDYKKIFLEIK